MMRFRLHYTLKPIGDLTRALNCERNGLKYLVMMRFYVSQLNRVVGFGIFGRVGLRLFRG